MQNQESNAIPGPVQLAAAVLLYLLLAAALILSYSIAEGAQEYTVHRLYSRLLTGEVVSLPQDSIDAPSTCYGYDGMLHNRTPLEVLWSDGANASDWPQGWYVELPDGYDYAILCNGHAPTWIEDHDPGTWADPAMLILDIAGPISVFIDVVEPDRVPVYAIACGPVRGAEHLSLCVTLPVIVAPDCGECPPQYHVNVASWVTWLRIRYGGE